MNKRILILSLLIGVLGLGDAFAQMERRTVDQDRTIELVFPTPRHINIPSTEPLSAGELYYSIMHTFGTIDNGWRNLWGIDSGANIRFSLEYGFTDRFSMHMGRSSMDRYYDLGLRYALLQQTASGSMPISIGFTLTGGITSVDPDFLFQEFDFQDRLSFFTSLPISKRFGSNFSTLVVPMFSNFSKTDRFLNFENQEATQYAGLGLGGRYKFSQAWAVTIQHITRYGIDQGLNLDVLAFGVDWETGGHVFQMYFTNVQGIADPNLLSAPARNPFDGGFRFGFNINRSFQL